jgi:hypothetical protein
MSERDKETKKEAMIERKKERGDVERNNHREKEPQKKEET